MAANARHEQAVRGFLTSRPYQGAQFKPKKNISSARPKTVILPPANSGTSGSNYNPRNTQCIPVVIIFAFLDLGKNS